MGVCLFQRGSGLGHAIDLSEQGVLVGHRSIHQSLHTLLFLLQSFVSTEESGAILVENVVHLLLLFGPQVKILGEVLVVPPAAGRSDLETASHRARYTLLIGCAAGTSTSNIARISETRGRITGPIHPARLRIASGSCWWRTTVRRSTLLRIERRDVSEGQTAEQQDGCLRANERTHQFTILGAGYPRALSLGCRNSETGT
jgi:hypothetical protein